MPIDPAAYEEWYRQVAEAAAPAPPKPAGPTAPADGHPGGFARKIQPDSGGPLRIRLLPPLQPIRYASPALLPPPWHIAKHPWLRRFTIWDRRVLLQGCRVDFFLPDPVFMDAHRWAVVGVVPVPYIFELARVRLVYEPDLDALYTRGARADLVETVRRLTYVELFRSSLDIIDWEGPATLLPATLDRPMVFPSMAQLPLLKCTNRAHESMRAIAVYDGWIAPDRQ